MKALASISLKVTKKERNVVNMEIDDDFSIKFWTWRWEKTNILKNHFVELCGNLWNFVISQIGLLCTSSWNFVPRSNENPWIYSQIWTFCPHRAFSSLFHSSPLFLHFAFKKTHKIVSFLQQISSKTLATLLQKIIIPY